MMAPEQFMEQLRFNFNGKTNLSAIFITYNTVHGYRGKVQTNSDRLNVFVASETDAASNKRLAHVANTIWDSANDDIALAEASQRNVEECLLQDHADVMDNSGVLLFVIYLGYSGFADVLELVDFLRETYPAAHIATLTCDCDLSSKREALSPKVGAGIINSSMVTHSCGGSTDMADILQTLIDIY